MILHHTINLCSVSFRDFLLFFLCLALSVDRVGNPYIHCDQHELPLHSGLSYGDRQTPV